MKTYKACVKHVSSSLSKVPKLGPWAEQCLKMPLLKVSWDARG